MLDLKDISKTFHAGTVNEKTALDGLSLHLNEGDFVTVIGGNGAGKSTMLNAVAGVWPVDEGTIEIDGVNVTKFPEYKRASYLGRVFQDPMNGTAATMQIEENMALASRRGKFRSLRKGITSKEREFYREQLKTLGLGLEDRMTSKVGLLSGGQRQALTLLIGGQGAGAYGSDRSEGPSDDVDDHPQHEGRHYPWEPADHDERGKDHFRRVGRRKEAADGSGSFGEI